MRKEKTKESTMVSVLWLKGLFDCINGRTWLSLLPTGLQPLDLWDKMCVHV